MLLKNYLTTLNFKKENKLIVCSPVLNKLNFHSTPFILSDRANIEIINESLHLTRERLSDLQLIKYIDKVEESNIPDILTEISSYSENFPWLLGEDGKAIDLNKQVDVFNAVKTVSVFLEKRFDLSQEQISNVKLSEIINPYLSNKEVTVLDLFNHFSKIYYNDKNSLIEEIASESTVNSLLDIKTQIMGNTPVLAPSKPLGTLGEITLNEITASLLNLKWEAMFKTAKMTVNVAPLVLNLASYSFMLKGYIKFVHNRPFDPNLDSAAKANHRILRNRHLALFSLLGAPLTLYLIKTRTSLGLKNMVNFHFEVPSGANIEDGNTNTNLISNSSFLLLISKINNKIPKKF